jgi:hypothetical protein
MNVKYVNFDKHRDQMVREVPDYDAQYLKENPEATEVPVRVPPFGVRLESPIRKRRTAK